MSIVRFFFAKHSGCFSSKYSRKALLVLTLNLCSSASVGMTVSSSQRDEAANNPQVTIKPSTAVRNDLLLSLEDTDSGLALVLVLLPFVFVMVHASTKVQSLFWFSSLCHCSALAYIRTYRTHAYRVLHT